MPSSDMTSAIRAAVEGDEDAFVQVWSEYQPRLLRFVTPLVDADDAADLTSAVWVDIVRRLHEFVGGDAEFRAWLFTLARRRAIDRYRFRSRHPEELLAVVDDRLLETAPEEPEVELETREATGDIIALIKTLPRSEAEVVLLRVVADLDVPTVARIVRKRAGTVRVLSHRGINRLRSAVETQEQPQAAKASCR
jgi:RNA polymerase sigma-70 factor (ECF subfamily)